MAQMGIMQLTTLLVKTTIQGNLTGTTTRNLLDGVVCHDKICYPNKIATPTGNYWKAIDNTYHIDNEYRLSKWQSANFTNYRKNGTNWEAYTCISRGYNTSGFQCKWIRTDIQTYFNSDGANRGCSVGQYYNPFGEHEDSCRLYGSGKMAYGSFCADGGWEQYCTSPSMPWLYDN